MLPLVFLLLAAVTATDAIPIAAARQRQAGETVTVLGLVTVPSARFRSPSDDNGFAVQDQTGGIWVSTKSDLRLREGQRVLVTGTLAVKARKLQIVPSNVQRLPGRELRVATGQVGPATLGFLITIEGRITRVVGDLPYGHKVFADDGSGETQVFLNASADFDAALFRPGRSIRVTGFASQYETTYELEPRSRRDVRIR